MKRLTVILMLTPLAVLMGQENEPKKTPTPPKTPPSSQAETPKIPEGAKQVEPYLYSYTDAQGKKWLFRQTPFGVVKWEDKPVTTPAMADTTNPVVITDLGDSVRFTSASPFGVQKWVRKKSELTEDEKTMMKREQEKRPAPDPKADDKPAASAKKTPEKQ